MIDQEDKEEILEMAAALPIPDPTTVCSSALCKKRADKSIFPPFCDDCRTGTSPRVGEGHA